MQRNQGWLAADVWLLVRAALRLRRRQRVWLCWNDGGWEVL